MSQPDRFDSSKPAEDYLEYGHDFIALAPVDGEEAQWVRFEDGWRLFADDCWSEPRTTEQLEGWIASWLLARSEHGD